jgi:uncharacterized integral membrane protein
MMSFRLTLILILSSLAVVFIAQNVADVEIKFLFWAVSISSALLIFFTLLSGFVIGWYLHSYLLYRKAKVRMTYLP